MLTYKLPLEADIFEFVSFMDYFEISIYALLKTLPVSLIRFLRYKSTCWFMPVDCCHAEKT